MAPVFRMMHICLPDDVNPILAPDAKGGMARHDEGATHFRREGQPPMAPIDDVTMSGVSK
jgi:hypothetical protein